MKAELAHRQKVCQTVDKDPPLYTISIILRITHIHWFFNIFSKQCYFVDLVQLVGTHALSGFQTERFLLVSATLRLILCDRNVAV